MKKQEVLAQEEQWTEVISAEHSLLHLKLDELWRYRDLVMLFVKRDFVAYYKQTILGPMWHIIQPLLTTLTYIIVFSRIAKLSTDGLPPVLFYMSGIVCWSYFSQCITKTANTFIANANIFGKVYFPRIVVPVSNVISNGLSFLIQFGLFIVIYCYYLFHFHSFSPNATLLYLPILIVQMAAIGLSVGIIVSSITTKYKDLTLVVNFGVQLLMYATPVVYPLSAIPLKYHWLFILNPVSAPIEAMRYSLFGTGAFNYQYLFISLAITFFLFISSVLLFNKVEKTFMDSV